MLKVALVWQSIISLQAISVVYWDFLEGNPG